MPAFIISLSIIFVISQVHEIKLIFLLLICLASILLLVQSQELKSSKGEKFPLSNIIKPLKSGILLFKKYNIKKSYSSCNLTL